LQKNVYMSDTSLDVIANAETSEKKLHMEYLTAQLAYEKFMLEKYIQQYKDKLSKGFVLDDTCFADVAEEDGEEGEKETLGETNVSPSDEEKIDASLKRRILLTVHPDKCAEKDAAILFQFVQDCKDNEVLVDIASNGAERIVKNIRNAMVGKETPTFSLEQEISFIRSNIAYKWKIGCVRLVTPEEYEKSRNAKKFSIACARILTKDKALTQIIYDKIFPIMKNWQTSTLSHIFHNVNRYFLSKNISTVEQAENVRRVYHHAYAIERILSDRVTKPDDIRPDEIYTTVENQVYSERINNTYYFGSNPKYQRLLRNDEIREIIEKIRNDTF